MTKKTHQAESKPPSVPREPQSDATPEPKTSSVLGFYSREGIAPVDDGCTEATVLLHVIPKFVYEKPGFRWRFAEQVMLANQQLTVSRLAISADGGPVVAFVDANHSPTGGIALMASCSSGAACNELAAAYKIAVPTSKPELFCGDDPPTIERFREVEVIPWAKSKIWSALPAKDDAVAQCVRLAACEAQKTGKLDGDPAIECQKSPGKFPIRCATEKFCDDVLACAQKQ